MHHVSPAELAAQLSLLRHHATALSAAIAALERLYHTRKRRAQILTWEQVKQLAANHRDLAA